MKEKWKLKECSLYRKLNELDTTNALATFANMIVNELKTKEEFSFIRGNKKFDKLLKNSVYIVNKQAYRE